MRYLNCLLLAALLGSLQGCIPVIAAGVGTGALMADDRRTTGAVIEDETIKDKVANQIAGKYKDDTIHVNVTSFNRHVLITGEVPRDDVKADITLIAARVVNVKEVDNELTASAPSDFASRSNDMMVTTNVKLRFISENKDFHTHVKVLTENGMVYLMGLVYHKEADAAAEIASTTNGVQSVIRVFDYLD